MAKAELMLIMMKKHLDKIDQDAIKFDEKENLEAGMRIRSRLKKLKKMADGMIHDTLETTREIKTKRGHKPYKEYYKKYKETGKWENSYAKRNKTEELPNT